MIFSLTACNSASEDNDSVFAPPLVSTDESLTNLNGNSVDDSTDSTLQTSSTDSSTSENSSDTSSSTTESSMTEQSSSTLQSSSTPQSSSTSLSSLPPQPQPVPKPEEPNILVAYFSATNTTEGVAKHISDALNADLYEITSAIPYTSADMDYHDDGSRSTLEMNDPNSRSENSGAVDNMEQYDVVFIGYPIWWGEAPRILCTFVESYDFSGKTIVPFCTSGGSGVGSSASNLERLTNGAEWLSGTRLNGGASKNDVVSWINDLGLDITAE